MSDVVYQLDAIGGNKVDREVAVAEKAINKVGRASSKSGFAILEASRAIEDFSMAGMKGAINNIPGLLMHLGVGMGLTGVISVATVAVWKGVDALEAYLNKLHDAKMAAAEFSAARPSIPEITELVKPKALEDAERMNFLYRKMAEAVQMITHARNLSSNESNAKEELEHAEQLLNLEKKGADEAERRLSEKERAIELTKREVDLASKAASDSKAQVDALEALRKSAAESADVDVEAMAHERTKKINAFEVDAYKKLLAKQKELRNNLSPARRALVATTTDILDPIAAMNIAKKRAKEYGDLLQIQDEGRLEAAVRDKLSNEENLKTLDAEIDAARKKHEMDKQSEESARRIQSIKEQEIETLAEIAELEEARKKQEDLRNRMLKERVTDPSAFLTSQGRAGLSGRETQSAMGLIGIARQQLSSLKQIERNTRNFNIAYA